MGRSKKKFTKKELKLFRDLILKKREELKKEIEYLRDTAMSTTIKEATGDHSSYSFHMADQGTDSMEREKAFLFASREGQYLNNLEKALSRIDTGNFGACSKYPEYLYR